jgi:MFS family permease
MAPNPAQTAPAIPGSRGPFGVYYGWYNVGISVVFLMLAVGSTAYSFGLFVKPVAQDLGLSRAMVNVGLILFHVGSLVWNPILGALYDRYPLKTLIRLSAVLFALGMIGAGLAHGAWLIALCIVGPIAAGTVGCSALPGMVLAARWFKEKRARAISIVAMGTSLGGMLVFPVIAVLITSFGWRTGLLVTGGSVGVTVLLLSCLIRPYAEAPLSGVETGLRGYRPDALPPLRILGTRSFWTVALSVALMMGIDQTLLATLTPYILDRGMSMTAAASVMSSTTAAAIAGKFLIAWIGDRSDLRILLAITALCGFLFCATLLTDPSYVTIFVVSLFTGAAIGVTYPLASALMARQFGSASIGTALGLQAPVVSLAASIALYFIGAVHDRTGSYDLAFAVFCCVLVVAAAIIPFIPKQPFVTEDTASPLSGAGSGLESAAPVGAS